MYYPTDQGLGIPFPTAVAAPSTPTLSATSYGPGQAIEYIARRDGKKYTGTVISQTPAGGLKIKLDGGGDAIKDIEPADLSRVSLVSTTMEPGDGHGGKLLSSLIPGKRINDMAANFPQLGGNTVLPPPQAASFQELGGNEPRLVSLGCYCGPKLTFRKLNWDSESLPFDWLRTRIDGILDFLQNDFDKFFHYDTKEQQSTGTGYQMWLFRSYYHSFWHDDLCDPADVEKYRRRIARFKAIDAQSKPVLFVRAVANDAEVQHLGTLCEVLKARFGRFAKLLAIVDFQPTDEPLLVQGIENLLLYKLNNSHHNGQNGNSPYVKPISEAITWAKTGQAIGARVIESLLSESFNPCNTGWIVPSIFDPFETVPRGGMKPLTSLPPTNGLQPPSLVMPTLATSNASPGNLQAPKILTALSIQSTAAVPHVTQFAVPQNVSSFAAPYAPSQNMGAVANQSVTGSVSAPLGVPFRNILMRTSQGATL